MWVVLLALLTVSALVNGDAKVAVLGHPDRHLGVVDLGACCLRCSVLASNWRIEVTTWLAPASWPRPCLACTRCGKLLFGRPIEVGDDDPTTARTVRLGGLPRCSVLPARTRSRSGLRSIAHRIGDGGGSERIGRAPRCYRPRGLRHSRRMAGARRAAAVMVVIAVRPTRQSCDVVRRRLVVAWPSLLHAWLDVTSRGDGSARGSTSGGSRDASDRRASADRRRPGGLPHRRRRRDRRRLRTRLPTRHGAAGSRPLGSARRHPGRRARRRSAVRRTRRFRRLAELAVVAVAHPLQSGSVRP